MGNALCRRVQGEGASPKSGRWELTAVMLAVTLATACDDWTGLEATCGSCPRTAATGLLGLVLGRFWDRISESATWRRDMRVRCYEELAATYYQLREAIRVLSAIEPATAESDLTVDHVLELAPSGSAMLLPSGYTAPSQ